MKNLSLTQLSYALALEETKNFGAAARKCHISQPTLSMQLQKLEEELGTPLFDRSKHPILPTEVGAKLLDQFRTIIQDTKRIDDILLESKGEIAGEFRLAIIPSLAPYLLPLFVAKFVKAYPKVSLILDELVTEQMIHKLKKDELDAGILVSPIHDDSVRETPLFYEPIWLYVSDDHPLRKAHEARASEIEAGDVWLLEEGHCFRGQVLQLCKKRRGDSHERKALRFEGGNLDVLRELVESGMGVTLLPDLAVRKLATPAQKRRAKPFASPVPVREVSGVQSRLFTKQRIFEALVATIRGSVPPELLRREKTKIVPLT